MVSRNVELEIRFETTTMTISREFGTNLAQLRKDLGQEYANFSFHLSSNDQKLTRGEEKDILVQDLDFIYLLSDNNFGKNTKDELSSDSGSLEQQQLLGNPALDQSSRDEEDNDSEEAKKLERSKAPASKQLHGGFIEDFIKRLKTNDKRAKERLAHEIRLIKKYAAINEEDLTFQVKLLSGSDTDSSPTYPNRRSKFVSKRDSKAFLYRGQEYSDEDLHKPIRARGTKLSITISGHIAGYTENSPYLSLTKDLDAATFYAMMYASKSEQKRAKILVIDKASLTSSKKYFDIRNVNHFNEEFRPKLIRKLEDPEKNQGFSFRAILNGSKDKEVVMKPENDMKAEIPPDMIIKMYIVEEITKEEGEFNFQVASATEESFEEIKRQLITGKKERGAKEILETIKDIRTGSVFLKSYSYDRKKWEKYVGKADSTLPKSSRNTSKEALIAKYFAYRIVESVSPPKIQTKSETAAQIYEALGRDDAEKLKSQIGKSPLNLEISESGKWNCLHFAAYKNSTQCLEYLLKVISSKKELKDLVNTKTENDEWTPLMISAIFNNADVLNCLILGKADKSLKDKNGRTALEFAKHYEALDCVKILEKN